MLKINKLHKTYKQGDKSVSVISDLNFELKKGEIISIMGKSGSGKSTLLSLVSGILKSDKGDILLDGNSYNTLNEVKLADLRASNIGFVFQNFHLVSYLNALENVMLPAKVNNIKNAKEKALELLEKVGLKDRVNHLPSELSGGEKQRVAIARALVHSPKLILADEPSGSLDEQTGDEVMNVLFDLVKKNEISLILVTHALNVAMRCQRIYNFTDGKLVAHEI
jgi:putative ABC transport system ATP-binding protein